MALVKYIKSRTCAKNPKVTSHLGQNVNCSLVVKTVAKFYCKHNDFLMLETSEPLPTHKPEGKTKKKKKKDQTAAFLT
jgi:hypothetical protein